MMITGTKTTWPGRLFLAEGQGLFLGSVHETDLHTHRAVEVCFALEGEFGLRSSADETWRSYTAATIASDHPHQLDGHGAPMAILYLDPEAAGNRSFAKVSHETGICPVPGFVLRSALPVLLHAWRKDDTVERIPALCHKLSYLLAGTPPWQVGDPRIRRALHLMRSAPGKRAGLLELSSAVSISPSRLSHLFREQTGMRIRRYLTWLRLGDAARQIARGVGVGEAARGAGFTDVAHLHRTFRRILGISPTALRRRPPENAARGAS